jgi:hypothetical protein
MGAIFPAIATPPGTFVVNGQKCIKSVIFQAPQRQELQVSFKMFPAARVEQG